MPNRSMPMVDPLSISCPQVVQVFTVTGVADDDPLGGYAAVAEEGLLIEPVPRRRDGSGS